VGEIFFGFVLLIGSFYAIYVTHFGGIELSGEMLKYAKYGSYSGVLLSFTFISITMVKYFKQFYVITNQRLVSKTNMINNNPDYVPLDMIQMTRIRQENLGLDEFLGYGHIFVSTAATSEEEVNLDYVPKPYEFKKGLEEAESYAKEDN
jgi:uncharacterized membrane protein YdbT with pleckstrin-like domain